MNVKHYVFCLYALKELCTITTKLYANIPDDAFTCFQKKRKFHVEIILYQATFTIVKRNEEVFLFIQLVHILYSQTTT